MNQQEGPNFSLLASSSDNNFIGMNTTSSSSNNSSSLSSLSNNIHVCVTGATGFIATHLVYQLLAKGYIVHATVRSLESGRRELIQNILQFDQKNSKEKGTGLLVSRELMEKNLVCFEADLLKSGSFEKAIKGCRFVHHTASPFKVDVKDPQRDLVDPALKGTLNVLQECVKLRKSQSSTDPARLQRIMLTSSIASIVETSVPGKVYDESDWNLDSSVNNNPYLYSKVVAEKAAWTLMQDAQAKNGDDFLELVTLCPAVVIGPPINPKLISQSHESIMLMARGEFPVILPLDFAFVDVRDVSKAHINAMEKNMDDKTYFAPSKKQRFVVSNGVTTSMKDLVNHMREAFPNPPYKWNKNLPTINLTGYLGIGVGKLAALIQPKGLRQYLNSVMGKPQFFNNSKIRNTFNLDFMNWKDSVTDSVKFLDENGFITSKL